MHLISYKEYDTIALQTNAEMNGGVTMANGLLQLRIDDTLRKDASDVYSQLGLDLPTAIRMFLTQALAVNGFPFEIKKATVNPYGALTEHEMLEKLETSRAHAAQGMYKDADEVIHDVRAKYGL